MATNRSHSTQVTNDQQMSAGTKQFLANVPSLPVAGQEMTPTQVAQMFDDRAASTQTVQTTTAARAAAIKANRNKRAQTAAAVKGFTDIVQGMYSQSPDTLAVFGLTPRKTAQNSVANKAVASLRNKATRKARHTMGKDQKAAIKGTVPASDIAIIQGTATSGSSTVTTPPPTNVTTPAVSGGGTSPVATAPSPTPVTTAAHTA